VRLGSLADEAYGGGAGMRLPPRSGNPGGAAARRRPPASRGLAVSRRRQDPIRYCQRHHRVYSPRVRQWITVPDDFITELRHADFPVPLAERHCPQCDEEIYARLKPQ
jgi:hypothetical protein